jgi:4-amino-4-deoxy-L-arabinose transferase-like glycosyltransferase
LVEREWREASDMRTSRLGLALVLAAAAALRFWGLGHDIPAAIPVDEQELVHRSFYMMRSGRLHPQFFDFGQLPLYLQLAVSVVRFLAGSTSGEWYSLAEASVTSFFLPARVMMAAAGTLTVLLVFRAGMRWGSRTALLAAALMAVVPLHVDYSHRAVPDALTTMFVALTVLLSIAASEKGTLRAFIWAGAAAGLATACNYHAITALVLPATAALVQPGAWRRRTQMTGVVVAAALTGFLLGAPYTLLDFPAFLNSFGALAAAARQAPSVGMPAALYYLDAVRNQFAWPGSSGPMMATGWPGLLLGLAGCALAVVRAVRGPGGQRWAIVAAFVLLHFVFISVRPVVGPRYLLPLLPAIALLVASAVIVGVSLLRRYEFPRGVRTALVVVLTLVALAPGAARSVQYNRRLTLPTTSTLAYDWILQNVAPGSVVVIEDPVLRIPAVVADARAIAALEQTSVEDLTHDGVTYVIASSTVYGKYLAEPRTYRREYLAYTRLFSETREVAKFTPDRRTSGPELRVLRLGP